MLISTLPAPLSGRQRCPPGRKQRKKTLSWFTLFLPLRSPFCSPRGEGPGAGPRLPAPHPKRPKGQQTTELSLKGRANDDRPVSRPFQRGKLSVPDRPEGPLLCDVVDMRVLQAQSPRTHASRDGRAAAAGGHSAPSAHPLGVPELQWTGPRRGTATHPCPAASWPRRLPGADRLVQTKLREPENSGVPRPLR